jgi:nicotinamidase-related amidase
MHTVNRFALLLMDLQNAVCKGMAAAEVERRGVLTHAAGCLQAARITCR